MFTDIVSTYDAKTMTLLSSVRHASCCGSGWGSSVDRNSDGSYRIKAQQASGEDVREESQLHVDAASAPVIAGGFFLVPWLIHVTKASRVLQISFSPIRTELLSVSEAPAAPYPDSVPRSDKALVLRTSGRRIVTTLWYDPCTFVLDAYGDRDRYVTIRSALL